MLYIWKNGREFHPAGLGASCRYDVKVIAPDRQTAWRAAKAHYGDLMTVPEGEPPIEFGAAPGRGYGIYYCAASEFVLVPGEFLAPQEAGPASTDIKAPRVHGRTRA